MLKGIGRISYWLLVLSFWFIVIAGSFPTSAAAVSTIDFSGTKDFFKDLKIGDKVAGDLSGGIPNPYEGKGVLNGYKINLKDEADPGKIIVSLQSCSFQFIFLCVGQSFNEEIYVYDSKFKPIGDEFKFSNTIDLAKIKIPEDKTLYLLVGTDQASVTGQYVLSANLKETSK